MQHSEDYHKVVKWGGRHYSGEVVSWWSHALTCDRNKNINNLAVSHRCLKACLW